MNFELCMKCPQLEITTRERMYCKVANGGQALLGYTKPSGIFLDEQFVIPEKCHFITEQMYKKEDSLEKLIEMVGKEAAEALIDDDPGWLQDV